MKHSDDIIRITGQITSGQGRGSSFVSQETYKKRFHEKLGYIPYPGTLNIEVHDNIQKSLQGIKGVTIEGFHTETTVFGKVTCLTCTLKKAHYAQHCTLILPEKSAYTKTLEVIAPSNLRRDLHLTDGDTVELTIRM